jgi:membrane protein DedA with SNARE-associated domain
VRTVLSRWDHLLERYGIRAVLIARLLPLARTFVSLPAGARRVRLIPFILLTTIGCALWAAGLILTGMIAASAWATVDTVIGRVLLVVGLLVLAGSVIGRRKHH